MARIQKIKNGGAVGEVVRAGGATGDLRLHQFRSRIFQNTRFMRVWLPPGYDDAENAGRHYPALYLNDGQNLFESSTAFAGVEWQVDETADRLIRAGAVPPMIFVGMDNTGKERIREYMPYRSMPFVESNYRVATGPENTGLGGSSLGALIALYTAMAQPGVIGRLLLESPSLWASGRQLVKESRLVRIWPERIFLAVGTNEAGSAERSRTVVDDVRELAAIIRRAVLSESRLRLVVKDGAGHNEAAWAERFPEALQFLFGS
jgi:enterochelin esterase-like enzyme